MVAGVRPLVHAFDCPVTGGDAGAIAGTLTLIVGATEEDSAPVLPILQTFSDKVFYMKKLRDSVVTTTVPTAPTAPTAPSDGNSDTASAEYAQYIIALAGDEWDSTNNTWASTDGTYYAALSSYAISNDSATYSAAEAAYYVAYSAYSTASSSVSTEWTNYVNTLLSNATIQIGSLAV